ncbi:DNA-binding proteins Bright/BRCAA1/RBP1 and proteins containing BRIGHT domain [Myotisia sp. PD_48]|nr:DNA-binding proteins Bright/BRCAA1/RBP1 and proteins containing BRIGHT domain [Myotisia sp. PD_48]
MASRPAISSIALALAAQTPSMDIPKRRGAKFSGGRNHSGNLPGDPAMLPTPPSSISPCLNPQGFGHRSGPENLPNSPPMAPLNVDSDLDLHDAADHRTGYRDWPGPTSCPTVAGSPDSLAGLDTTGDITPAMLARHHLPEILLDHGPLAIRHIMGYLTTSVPGFAIIPPAKARRLVVAGLEGKGGMGEGSGVHADVEFEKVGWGRWGAKRRGLPSRDHRHAGHAPSSTHFHRDQSEDKESHAYGSSLAGESAVFSHADFEYGDHPDDTSFGHEADKMSLDGDDDIYCSSSEASENNDDRVMDGNWDEADLTDEEDWAQIGAAALRARSLATGTEHKPGIHNATPSNWRTRGYGGGPSYSALTKSAPAKIPIQHIGFSYTDGVHDDSEERAAVEALLQLGSM